MRTLLAIIFTAGSVWAQWVAPETLEGACDYNSCTPKMQKIYDGYMSTPHAPMYVPGMYSGDCYHQSWWLDPNTTHYVGLLIDDYAHGRYMSPTLQFFGDKNDMSDWTLEEGRKNMSVDWTQYEPMRTDATGAVQWIMDEEQGVPALIYWARQNPQTKVIYLLAFAKGRGIAFCEAAPNPGGL